MKARAALCAGAACVMSLAAASATAQAPAQPPRSTQVDEIVVRPGQVPVPEAGEGAPLLTAKDLDKEISLARRDFRFARDDRQRCIGTPFLTSSRMSMSRMYLDEEQAAQKLVDAGLAAEKASEKAERARIDAANGKATKAEVEASELARQAAVHAFLAAKIDLQEAKARTADWQSLARTGQDAMDIAAYVEARSAQRRAAGTFETVSVPAQFQDLRLTRITVTELDSGVLRVTGMIENPRRNAVPVPPLSLTVIDSRGGALSTALADPSGGRRIAPGQAQPFSYDIQPMPQNARSVLVTFGDPQKPPWRYSANFFCAEHASRGRNLGGLNNEDRRRMNRLGIIYGGGNASR